MVNASPREGKEGLVMTKSSMPANAVLEKEYAEVTALYDCAEELVNAVEDPAYREHMNERLELVEPLIEQICESADVLSEEFINLAENHARSHKSSKSRIEGALRKMYMAMEHYSKRSQGQLSGAKQSMRAAAEKVVRRTRQQVERVVAIFVQYVDLSLELIMNKMQIDQLRAAQPQVALMLHRMSQQHQ
jgi:hypothetical protein